MDIDYNKKQTLIVELEEECFTGDFKFMKRDRSQIGLINVIDNQTGEKLRGLQYFYKSDIKSIKILKQESTRFCDKDDDSSGTSQTQTASDIEAHLTSVELEDIETLSRNAQYIYKTDRFYHDAVKDMSRQNEIVLHLESCETGRNIETTVITIATKESVYIFDIRQLGQVFPELKEIFESNRPKKIIHDARKTTDNLKYRQGIELKGIFDTLFAHLSTGGDRSVLELYDCVRYYFNLPENFFSSDKLINWHERPLHDNQKCATARKVLFIYKLHDYLLHENILRKFYKECDKFANVYSNNKDACEVASDMASNKNNSVNEVEDIDLDLIVPPIDF